MCDCLSILELKLIQDSKWGPGFLSINLQWNLGQNTFLSLGDTGESIVYKMSIILFGPECAEET